MLSFNRILLAAFTAVAFAATLPGTLAIVHTVSGTVLPAAPPTISTPAFEAGTIRFSFNAESNRTYAVEFRDSLNAAGWGTLTNIPAHPADTTIQVINAVAGGERYFRVRTP